MDSNTQKTPTDTALALTGPDLIAEKVKTLPDTPGVYRMIGSDGTTLYVGKARHLKHRVASYAKLSGHSNRIARMIVLTASMEFITTQTEADALLLEANLIKRLKPRFNVLMRDDKSFPFILITDDHPAPRIVKHRGVRNCSGDYFGPFASVTSVNHTLEILQRAFLLRTCSDSVYASRTRPCLLHQIKRCSAPCTGHTNLDDYGSLVHEAREFLSGKSHRIQNNLSRLMSDASQAQDYEQAAIYRDRIYALTKIQSTQGINPASLTEADVFASHQNGGRTCIQVFFFRAGQNWGNRAWFPRHDRALNSASVMDAFLAQFYENRPPPRLILLDRPIHRQSLLAEALSLRAGRRINITTPQRGEKRALTLYARDNACMALERYLAETSSQYKLLEAVTQVFNLPNIPQRIEVYDNSHTQGSHPVGGMIVAGPEGFIRNQYRRFNIRNTDDIPGDDYAMIREVFTRRFKLLLQEEPNSKGTSGHTPRPDLVLIDGGAGHLSTARAVMNELALSDIPLIAIAKGSQRNAGEERFFMKGNKVFSLPPRSPALYYLQRLRDEAHRFAISGHRARRRKTITENLLDEVPGIGTHRKRILLHHFGSARAVKDAASADLAAVKGISTRLAQAIHDYFHDAQT
ncbi:MAG: excinuclease ABC subunit UvrC [Parvularculales bacterium]